MDKLVKVLGIPSMIESPSTRIQEQFSSLLVLFSQQRGILPLGLDQSEMGSDVSYCQVLNKIKEDQGRSKKEELNKFEAKNQEKEAIEGISKRTILAQLIEHLRQRIGTDRLKIDNLTQEILVGSTFNLLKGSCKSFAELKYHFEECYKAVNDRLDWNNPEGREYLFGLSKPLPLIEDRGRQVIPADYFINNDLEYLKGGSSSSKYATFITRTKAAKYDNIEGIEDMVSTLWSPLKVAYNKHAVWGTYH
ncbi:hypothetical protein Tco_0073236 [Tanacetum coccineum]